MLIQKNPISKGWMQVCACFVRENTPLLPLKTTLRPKTGHTWRWPRVQRAEGGFPYA